MDQQTKPAHTAPSFVSYLVTYGAYPIMVFGSLAVGTLLIESGSEPSLVVAVVSLTCALIAYFLESTWPETRAWAREGREVVADILHAVLSNPIPTAILRAATYSLLVAASGAISTRIGFALWPAEWPLLAQLVLALLLAELVSYAVHRFLHESRLWPLHAVHHCSPRMYFLLAMRKHPLQSFITYGARFSTLWLLGVPESVIGLYTILTAANSYMQHANLHVRTGVFGQVFATPELHRVHHSNSLDELDSNYGDVLIVWDRLLGTRREPDLSRELGDSVGLPGIRVAQTYMSHLRLPFIWSRLVADAAREASDPASPDAAGSTTGG